MTNNVVYKKNFLKEVIVRVDFVAPIPELNSNLPPKFAAEISKIFPIIEPSEEIGHELQFGSAGISARQSKTNIWNFYSKDRLQQLSISASFVFISEKKYVSFKETKGVFTKVLSLIHKFYGETRSSRLGMRYINEITPSGMADPTDFSEYIDNSIVSLRSFFHKEEAITRIFHILELSHDDFNIRLQVGLHNPDFPSRIVRPSFIIDIDTYNNESASIAECIERLDVAHSHTQNLFERCITDRLREIMDA